jgi:hypothetical protein
MSNFLASGISSMVFEHLQDFFDFKNWMNGFIQFHQLCSHVSVDHILGSVVWVLGASRFLALAKPSSNIHSIVVGEAFYWLMSRAFMLIVLWCICFSFVTILFWSGG